MLFFFNDTATTEIYTLSLHDALPIYAWHEIHARITELERDEQDRLRLLDLWRFQRSSSRNRSCSSRSEEHTSELQSPCNVVCRLLLEKKHEYATSRR